MVAIIEHTGLVCYVWHLPLFFLALIFIGVMGCCCFHESKTAQLPDHTGLGLPCRLGCFLSLPSICREPWTRDSQVRANIVGIAPRVSGPIVRVAVHDNEEVKKGYLLFEIDPADFQAQLTLAAGQVLNGEANLKQQQQHCREHQAPA